MWPSGSLGFLLRSSLATLVTTLWTVQAAHHAHQGQRRLTAQALHACSARQVHSTAINPSELRRTRSGTASPDSYSFAIHSAPLMALLFVSSLQQGTLRARQDVPPAVIAMILETSTRKHLDGVLAAVALKTRRDTSQLCPMEPLQQPMQRRVRVKQVREESVPMPIQTFCSRMVRVASALSIGHDSARSSGIRFPGCRRLLRAAAASWKGAIHCS